MLGIFYVKNALEILFFSTLVYYFSLWLKTDKRHNLLLHFYTYCIGFFLAFILDFSTISLFLLYSSPIILILFIVFHEEILQRNFVTLNNNQPVVCQYDGQWLENLIRISLLTMNNNKSLYVVIENNSDLKPFMSSDYIFNSPLSLELLMLITESSHFDSHKIIWCNSQGKLIGINSSWSFATASSVQNSVPSWQQEALLMTLKTDTIIFKVNTKDRNFEIVLKGTLYHTISAHQVVPFIKKHLPLSHINIQKGANNNDAHNVAQKLHNEQPNH